MDLLKRLPLDEKYRHPAMEGLAGLFRFPRGFKNHMLYSKVYSMMARGGGGLRNFYPVWCDQRYGVFNSYELKF